MKLEDYGKYYIQGSDHYLIPKDDFSELVEENQELKKQLENYKKLGFKHLQDKNNNLETQQKEFINYLEEEIKTLEKDILETVDDMDIYMKQVKSLIMEEILQKYKSIIGVLNETNIK